MIYEPLVDILSIKGKSNPFLSNSRAKNGALRAHYILFVEFDATEVVRHMMKKKAIISMKRGSILKEVLNIALIILKALSRSLLTEKSMVILKTLKNYNCKEAKRLAISRQLEIRLIIGCDL